MAEQGSASRRSTRDKERAAVLKAIGEERRSGKCPICYGTIPNDTFGGWGAAGHISRCTAASPKYSRRMR